MNDLIEIRVNVPREVVEQLHAHRRLEESMNDRHIDFADIAGEKLTAAIERYRIAE
ncbi:MAG: hypothetical protein KGL39_46875 [Patescibacteria group bacterium]|nr:hypothetical protein [Patescibacteria group bacterium]